MEHTAVTADIERLQERIAELEAEVRCLRRETTAGTPRESTGAAELPLSPVESTARLLFDRLMLPYQSLDEHGRVLEVNQAWLDTLGYRREEVVGRSFGEFLHPQGSGQSVWNFPGLQALGEGVMLELELVPKQGPPLQVVFSGMIQRDRDFRFGRSHCFFLDIGEQKRTQQALRASEEKLRLAMEAIADGLWDWDLESGAVYYSPGWTRILGLEEVEPTLQAWEARIHPDDRPSVLAGLDSHLAGGTSSWSAEHRLRAGDGSWRWVLGRGRILARDDRGGPRRMVGTLTDITERKTAEETAAQRTRELETLHRLSEMALGDKPLRVMLQEIAQLIAQTTAWPMVAIEFYDPQRQEMESMAAVGMERCASDAAASVPLDQKPSGVVARSGQPLWQPQARAGDGSRYETPPFPGAQSFICVPLKLEQRVIGTLSLASPAIVPANPLTPQHASRLANFIAAIVEHKCVETALRASEEHFQTTFHTSPDAINVNRLQDGVYVDVNQGFVQLTGYTREEVIGKSLLELDIWDNPDDRKELIRGLERTGQYSNLAAEFRLKNGTIRSGLMSARVIGLHNQPHISELRLAEAERERLQAQLLQAQRMESIGRLAGGVARDFNNKLAVILGHAEMLMEEHDTQDAIHADLEAIRKAAQNSSELTRQQLAFARQQPIAPRALDLNESVEKALKMLRRLIGEGIDLAWKPENGVWAINIDPAQIKDPGQLVRQFP
jgi:PAS domain S-box-containing protein